MPSNHVTHTPTVAQMKAEASALRAAAAQQPGISHSQALERVARKHGFANWNTARACAAREIDLADLRIGVRVRGRYLLQPFTGRVHGLERLGAGASRVTVVFDEAVDVVRFESFSSFRTRATAIVRDDGASIARLSNGERQLVLEAQFAGSNRR